MAEVFFNFLDLRPWVYAALLAACALVCSGIAVLAYSIFADSCEKRKTVFAISFCASTVGSVVGFVSGLSLAPVSTPLLTGVFGVVSALSVFLFQKDRNLGWEVASATLTFSYAMLLTLLIGLDTSRTAKEYQHCLKIYSDPETTNEVIYRLSDHCGASFPHVHQIPRPQQQTPAED